MIYTARQLDDLHKTNGSVVLPYRARLTPLAQDWVRQKQIVIGYGDDQAAKQVTSQGVPLAASQASDPPAAGAYIWWTDGPAGPAKAALMAQAKESALTPSPIANDDRQLVSAIKHTAAEIKMGQAVGAILIVKQGAAAVVYANRCPSLRAILGTCLEAVDQGVQLVAANVLVIEHPYKTLPQVKNLLARFVRGKRELSDDVRKQLQELGSCG